MSLKYAPYIWFIYLSVLFGCFLVFHPTREFFTRLERSPSPDRFFYLKLKNIQQCLFSVHIKVMKSFACKSSLLFFNINFNIWRTIGCLCIASFSVFLGVCLYFWGLTLTIIDAIDKGLENTGCYITWKRALMLLIIFTVYFCVCLLGELAASVWRSHHPVLLCANHPPLGPGVSSL